MIVVFMGVCVCVCVLSVHCLCVCSWCVCVTCSMCDDCGVFVGIEGEVCGMGV